MASNHDMFNANVKAILQQTIQNNNVLFSPGGAFNVGGMQSKANPAAMTGAAPAYAPNSVYTIASGNTVSPVLSSDAGIALSGNADIRFGNISLKDFMESVSKRLALMVPHPELERQWDELRTLGEAYRACEKECLDKAKVWDILKRD